jgi:hypothetical protein
VSPPQPATNSLPDARFEDLKAFGHAQVQVQEAMIYAPQIDSQGAAFAFGSRLRETRHRTY